MKILDIALKDLTRSFRSAFAIIFMFGVPLLVTGMFYLMFGSMADNGGFNLPRTKVIIANMDQGGPKFRLNPKNIPGGRQADTMGELIVSILQSDEMTDMIHAYAPWILTTYPYENVLTQPALKGYKQHPFVEHQWRYYDVEPRAH